MHCPSCDAEIEPKLQTCPKCGAALPKTISCPECGKDIFETWNVCPYCGKERIKEHTDPSKKAVTIKSYGQWFNDSNKKNPSSRYNLNWLLGGVLFFGGFMFFYTAPSPEDLMIKFTIKSFVLVLIINLCIYFINKYTYTKYYNEYYLYVVDALLRQGEYIDAVGFCLKLSRLGIPEYHYNTTITAVMKQCENNGDEYRASLLKQKLESK